MSTLPPIYKLRDWVPVEKLSFGAGTIGALCANPAAISFLEKHLTEELMHNNIYHTSSLCNNPNGWHLVEKYWEQIFKRVDQNSSFWRHVSETNPDIGVFLHKNWETLPTVVGIGRGGWGELWTILCQNPGTAFYAEKCRDNKLSNPKNLMVYGKYAMYHLGANPGAISFIDKLNRESSNTFLASSELCHGLCANPIAVPFLETKKYGDFINEFVDLDYFRALCQNPNAYPLLKKYWHHLYDKNAGRMIWRDTLEPLCANPGAVRLLEAHWDKLRKEIDETEDCWEALCRNPGAIDLLDRNWDHIMDMNDREMFWEMCENPAAGDLIGKHYHEIQEDIEWSTLSANPAIFELDLAAMREQARPFAEELAAKVFHPSRIAIWSAWEDDEEDVAEEKE